MLYKSKVINGVKVNLIRSANTIIIEYPATIDENGKFHVITHNDKYENIPFIGDFESISEIEEFAEWMQYKKIKVYVCHLMDEDENAYILYDLPKQISYYISTRS